MDQIEQEYLKMFEQDQANRIVENEAQINKLLAAIERSKNYTGKRLTPDKINSYNQRIKELQKENDLIRSGNSGEVVPEFFESPINRINELLVMAEDKIGELSDIILAMSEVQDQMSQIRKETKINCKEVGRTIQKVSDLKKWFSERNKK